MEHASWRVNGFSDEVWECIFGTVRTRIDFRKQIDDGSLLTDARNQKLLSDVKRFLCLQTHPVLTGSVTLSPTTARARLAQALHILDYFLIHSDRFAIARHGFDLVTSNDVSVLIEALTSQRSIKQSIYEPTARILTFLGTVTVSSDGMETVRRDYPDLFCLHGTSDLALPAEQVLVARAWLMVNACYSPMNRIGSVTEYRYRVSRKTLLSIVIGSRVLSDLKFDGLNLDSFDVAPARCFAQELPSVPVSNLDDDDRASVEHAGRYVDVLRSMSVAHRNGLSVLPESALHATDTSQLLLKERTKERARCTTLPFEVANELLSKAIGFFLEYGTPLVDYYLALARSGDDIRRLPIPVPPKLTALGVNSWSSQALTPNEFFMELRAGANLFNMLEVLYGAVAIIVNTLMARRVSELEDLESSSIVEENGAFFLAFELRKANVGTHRRLALRPLPDIATQALKLIARVPASLASLGYPAGLKLFEMPYSAWNTGRPIYGTCSPDLRRAFDRFCDYEQVALDDQGRRYYVRAHQLRRNFAMLFFWKGSFGGIEVLRYFLGHSKPSMTYRYVTEAISGKVLRRVKATVANALIKTKHPATDALAELICARYGLTLNELHILPERDVVDYVDDLLVSGDAAVEPEFFTGDNGEEYRILYRVLKPTARAE